MNDKHEKMLGKIRALLDKTTANGCSEEEELSALAKARALMDAYDVSAEDLQLTKEEKAILREEPRGTKDAHGIKRNLYYAVGEFTGCQAWRKSGRDGGIAYCGLPADARFATWLLDHLAQHVQSELFNFLAGNAMAGKARREAINGFVLGITERISQRLLNLSKPAPTATANSRALIVAKQQIIKARLDELGIKLKWCSGSERQHDDSSRNAGRSAADKASFGRPVTGQAGVLRIGSV